MNAGIISAFVILAAAAADARAQDSSPVQGDPVSVANDAWHGTFRIFLGGKTMNDDDWEPVESQSEVAFLSDFGPDSWSVRLALDLRLATSDEKDSFGLEVSSSSWELNLGVRKFFDTQSIVKPFIGGGLAFGGAAFDVEIDNDSDAGIGIWVDAGIDFNIGGPFSFGFELGYSTIPIDIGGVDTDAGGIRFGLTLGFSW